MKTFIGVYPTNPNDDAYRFTRGEEMIIHGSLEYFDQRFNLK
jgi:hypothetical protein